MKYLYRNTVGVTRISLKAFAKHRSKIGTPISIRGYYEGRYNGTPNPWYRVALRGTAGTMIFGGFSWGYGGEGPRGLQLVLDTLGVNKRIVDQVCFKTNNVFNHSSCGKMAFHLMLA